MKFAMNYLNESRYREDIVTFVRHNGFKRVLYVWDDWWRLGPEDCIRDATCHGIQDYTHAPAYRHCKLCGAVATTESHHGTWELRA